MRVVVVTELRSYRRVRNSERSREFWLAAASDAPYIPAGGLGRSDRTVRTEVRSVFPHSDHLPVPLDITCSPKHNTHPPTVPSTPSATPYPPPPQQHMPLLLSIIIIVTNTHTSSAPVRMLTKPPTSGSTCLTGTEVVQVLPDTCHSRYFISPISALCNSFVWK